MSNQNKTTSEDYLDSLLNSIMNNEKTSTNDEDLGLFSVSEDELEEDLLGDLESEVFGELEDSDVQFEDEEYFKNEISDAELFDLDEDILSMIDESDELESAPKKIHEIIKEHDKDEVIEEKAEEEALLDDMLFEEMEPINDAVSATDVNEAIATNDSISDDDLQGLLDVMGIEDESQDVAISLPEEKKKKKLFGKKNKKAKKKEKEDEESSFSSDDMLDLSSLGDMISSSSEDVHSLDFSSVDMIATDDNEALPDDGFSGKDNLDFDFGDDDFAVEASDSNAQDTSAAGDSSSFDDFGFEFMDEDEGKGGKKGKKKKEKVKKDKKAKKEKKPKKAAAKAKKKEKKPKEKEPDEIIKVSKGLLFLLLSFVAVAIFTVILGGDYYTYNKKIAAATNEYVNQNYSEAYNTLFGLEMKKEDDVELFNQIQTVMFVNRHYEAYTYLIQMDEYEQGLYSLLKGVKMFDKYQNTGRDLNCYDDMQDVLGWIDKGLMETYGLTESQARELNLLSNDEQLGLEVSLIAQEAREKAEAEKEAEKEAAEEAAKEEAKKEEEE